MEKNAHVLVVDDDEGILRLAQRLLERVGYRVSTASSAEVAREVVGRDTPDLLVLDYQLGTAETGLDFFRRLRADEGTGENVPAILVTGFTDEARVIEALRAGVADVVPKAGEYLEYLPQAVERVLSQARMAEQVAEAESIKEREGYYRMMAEGLPQLVWTCTPQGECDFLSKQWVEYTGIPESEQLGLGWVERALHPEDQARTIALWEAALAGKADYDLEFRLRRHDGAWRWFKTRGVALRDKDGRALKWFGTCTDVHDQRQALEERGRLLAAEQKARQQAEEANRAKDQFLAMLSHELRTPLTPVLAAARILEGAANLPADLAEEAQIIRRNVELEARLIDDLLDLTRVAKGKLQLSMETVDVHGAIQAVLAIFRDEIQAKALQVHVSAEAKRHHVRADHARLQQMLWNLIKNAAKFTPEHGEIFIRTIDAGENRLQVEVRDTGIGIEPANLERLFNAFEQGNVEVTRQFGGLGLGLAITKSLADLHGGRVWATSEGLGKGATFTLELPAVSGTIVKEKGAAEIPGAKKQLRILLVEDHVDTAALMKKLMQRLGHEVVLAGTVEGALAAWSRAQNGKGDGAFDLLMSDVGLPDGSGLEVIRSIRDSGSEVPAIALTGFGMEDDVQRCLRAGFTAHLTKPVDFARLEGLVADLGGVAKVK
jgi:PAS domain S-box-containing protein